MAQRRSICRWQLRIVKDLPLNEFGKARIETSADEQKFTLKLPRTVMEGIRDVKFFDAKGQALEGRRTGTGYMNDAGEMGLAVTTPLKTVTLEFEVWQGRRTIKVPFKVQTGLGVGGVTP